MVCPVRNVEVHDLLSMAAGCCSAGSWQRSGPQWGLERLVLVEVCGGFGSSGVGLVHVAVGLGRHRSSWLQMVGHEMVCPGCTSRVDPRFLSKNV